MPMKKTAHKKRIRIFYSALLGLSLVVGLTTYHITKNYSFLPEYFSNPFAGNQIIPVVPSPITKKPPVRIRIAKLNIELPIKAALLQNGEWDMFDDAVSWLASSAVPGDGNIILYGHNRKHLLSKLTSLTQGDIIEVLQGNEWISYKVYESRIVNPKDVESIVSSSNQLTIYTCEGIFDQKRRVVYAKPQ